ncbi:MAG: hypothetical protein ABGX27_08770 [Desulfurobacteriaceae bacterium]
MELCSFCKSFAAEKEIEGIPICPECYDKIQVVSAQTGKSVGILLVNANVGYVELKYPTQLKNSSEVRLLYPAFPSLKKICIPFESIHFFGEPKNEELKVNWISAIKEKVKKTGE